LAAAVVGVAAGACATLPEATVGGVADATVGGVEEAVPASSDAARVHAVPAAQISRNMQGNFVIDL
jgi:hypothetical protein